MTKIVTHPGRAHRDDFLSCCLLLAHDKDIVRIERREPTREDLMDKTTIVVDVGDELDIEHRNYDHHQLLREHKPFCGLSAVIKYELDMDEEFRQLGWLEVTEQFDSKGPVQTAQLQGWNTFPFNMQSPIENALLRMFAKCEVVGTKNPLFSMMCMIGDEILNNTKQFAAGLEAARKDASLFHVPGIPEFGLWFNDKENLPYINAVRDRDYPLCMFTVIPDNRGPGLRVFRYDDYQHMDLSKLEGHPDIHFAHKNGFLAVTKEPMDELQMAALIQKAVV